MSIVTFVVWWIAGDMYLARFKVEEVPEEVPAAA
jgi:hypothetical protein